MSRIDSKLNIILVLAAMLVIFVLCLSSCGGNNDTDPASSTPSQISTGQSASQTQKASGVAETSAQSSDDKGSGDNDSQSNAQAPDNKAEKHEAGSDNSGNGGYDKNDSPAGEKAVSAPKSNENSGAHKNDKSEAESSRTSKNDKKALTATGLRIKKNRQMTTVQVKMMTAKAQSRMLPVRLKKPRISLKTQGKEITLR